MLLVDKMNNCSEVRKKRTFDIAFLTGQEDTKSVSVTTTTTPGVVVSPGNAAPEELLLEDSNSSSIDVTSEQEEVRKVRKKEIRFESKRTIEQTSDSLKIKENVEFSFPSAVPPADLHLPHSFYKFYQQQQQQQHHHPFPKRFPDPFVYYPPMMESTRQHFSSPPQPSNSSVAVAAAAAATLLPPSLTALTLPAQNVCAKCNIGFRMTSDLVYHMRSHHKRDGDPQKKKREDKLKCPVCHESFRERHHLTRHMTAHQDRAEERDEHLHHNNLAL